MKPPRRETKPSKQPAKMDPTAVPDPADVTMALIEQLKAEHPVTARIATESIPRKPRD